MSACDVACKKVNFCQFDSTRNQGGDEWFRCIITVDNIVIACTVVGRVLFLRWIDDNPA